MSIVDRERLAKLYDAEAYSSNTDAWEDAASPFRARALLDALQKANVSLENLSIVDVGCGSGGVLREIAAVAEGRSLQLYGLDASRKAVDIAQSILRRSAVASKIDFSVGLASEIEGRHDLCTLIHVLEHVPDMLEMLEVCASKSRMVYINVPFEVNLLYALRPGVLRGQYQRYGHLHFFDEDFFEAWLEANGYTILARSYSEDYRVEKEGATYRFSQVLRATSQRLLGPRVAAKLLPGISGGFLVKRKGTG